MTKEELLEKAKLLPLTPGVYLMRNKKGTVIYVGKSKALRNRVTSYFSPSVPHYGKTEKMICTDFVFSSFGRCHSMKGGRYVRVHWFV